ncbi:MAG TPA: ABC transporter permease [Acidimicrobiia bacterium]|jgi:lipooligosaccharide transport system permease protein|nr:ABC transporter permease [Acidimicrobiia bacterium]
MTTRGALRYFETRARVYRHVWRGSMISTFLNPIMFLAAMGLGLGSLVDEGPGAATLEGVSYLAFLAPGLMAATAMQAAAGDSSWPVMAGIKWLKTYDAALATPVGVPDLVTGHVAFVTVRVVFASGVYGLIAAGFGALSVPSALLATLPAGLTGLAFAAPVTAYTASLQRETGLTALFRFGIVPMFLFSGTFFPISQLPGYMQPLAYLTPLWHGVELTRAAALATSPAWNPVAHVLVLIVFTVAGTILAIRQLGGRLIT